MAEPLIEIKNLHKSYGNIHAVNDVSLTVYKGDVYGFLGPNGAGKSTTIRCLLSLISPNHGEINIFQKDLKKHKNQILAKVGCIVEKPDFYKYLSAWKNLEVFGRISGKTITKKRIEECLEFVGLSGRQNEKVSGYSHGMRQRLGLAQTLLHDPELIILDEPTTGLDPQGIIDLRKLILSLQKDFRKTVVLSSHILSEIELIANRCIVINKGKSVIEGEISSLLNDSELEVNIEVNNVKKAIESLSKNGFLVTVISEKEIKVMTEKEKIPQILKVLNSADVLVYSVEKRRKLEDFYLKIVNN